MQNTPYSENWTEDKNPYDRDGSIIYHDLKIASGHKLKPNEVVHEVMVGKAVVTYIVKEFSPEDSPTVLTSDGIKQKSQLRLSVDRYDLVHMNRYGWFGKKSRKSRKSRKSKKSRKSRKSRKSKQ